MTTCTKRYSDFPAAHRQPNHEGHCRFVHGHNWSFEFEFAARELDKCGFVVDFGGLGPVRDWLTQTFDHTLLLNEDDPWLNDSSLLTAIQITTGATDVKVKAKVGNLRLVPDCSSEGLARLCFDQVDKLVMGLTNGRVTLARCTVFEDSKNSATVTAIQGCKPRTSLSPDSHDEMS